MLIRLSVVCALILVQCNTASAGTPVETVRIVEVAGDEERPFRFVPVRLVVAAGTTVRFVNETPDVFHTVTFADAPERRVSNGTYDRSLAVRGDLVERTFDRAGTFFYFCQPHSAFMAASIVVTPPPPAASRSSPLSALGLLGVIFGSVALVAFLRRQRQRA